MRLLHEKHNGFLISQTPYIFPVKYLGSTLNSSLERSNIVLYMQILFLKHPYTNII